MYIFRKYGKLTMPCQPHSISNKIRKATESRNQNTSVD